MFLLISRKVTIGRRWIHSHNIAYSLVVVASKISAAAQYAYKDRALKLFTGASCRKAGGYIGIWLSMLRAPMGLNRGAYCTGKPSLPILP